MRIRAYNLIPGAAFVVGGKKYLVSRVSRDLDIETITIRSSKGTPLAFDFCDEVELIGLDANLGQASECDDIGTDWEPTPEPTSIGLV